MVLPVSVALVQTNVPQQMKWDAERFNTVLAANLDSIREARARIIVLPETALPTLLENVPPNYLELMNLMLRQRGGVGVVGVFTRDGDGHIYNSAVTVGSDRVQQYSKRHLVPFGEFSPPMFGWFYQLAHIPMSDQSRGRSATPLAIAGQKLAVNICYEDVFGEELIASLPEATTDAEHQQPRLVWRLARPAPASADRADAGSGDRPADAAFDQYRHDRGDPPGRIGPGGAAGLHARRAERRGAWLPGADALCPLGNWAILAVIASSLAAALWRRRA